MIVVRPTAVRRNGKVKKLYPGWVPSPPSPHQTKSLAEESLEEWWSGLKGVVYHVQQATEEMKKFISKDKFIQEEVLIPVAEAGKKVKENYANTIVKKMIIEKKKKMIMIRGQYEESLEE